MGAGDFPGLPLADGAIIPWLMQNLGEVLPARWDFRQAS
jgi:hypothetical protein